MKIQTLYPSPESPPDPHSLRARLAQSGALLIRGNALELDQFEDFTEKLCEKFHHVGGRRKVAAALRDGYTTHVPEKNTTIFTHSESRFRPCDAIPDTCIFYCVTPPDIAGGETTLVDGVEMLSLLPAELRMRFEEQGVIYGMSWEPARWTAEFNVQDESGLKAFLARFPDARYTLAGSILDLQYRSPAIIQSKGQRAFANGILAHLPEIDHPRYLNQSVHARPTNRICFGDGEPLSRQVIHTLIDIQDKILYPHRWHKGDMLILDNLRFMHGRQPTAQDCERVLYTRFGCLKQEADPCHSPP